MPLPRKVRHRDTAKVHSILRVEPGPSPTHDIIITVQDNLARSSEETLSWLGRRHDFIQEFIPV